MNQLKLCRGLRAAVALIAMAAFTGGAGAAIVSMGVQESASADIVAALGSQNGSSLGTAGLGDSVQLVPALESATSLAEFCQTRPTYSADPVPVPEPSTYLAGALLALAFGVQAIRYRKNRKQTV
jgi:hypothetical protein